MFRTILRIGSSFSFVRVFSLTGTLPCASHSASNSLSQSSNKKKAPCTGALFNNWRKGRDCFARYCVSAPPSHSFGYFPSPAHSHVPLIRRRTLYPRVRIKKKHPVRVLYSTIGGKAEIRTLGGIAPSTVFKTAALNHSATFPY